MTRHNRSTRAFSRSFEVLESRRLLTTSAYESALVATTWKTTTVNYSAATTVPVVSFSDVVVAEGRRGSMAIAMVTATLSEAPSKNVMIGYKTLAGTATSARAARDFVAASGTITIRAGQTSGRIRIRIVGDNRAEPDEAFQVIATKVRNATLTPGASSTRVVIRDDDSSPVTRPTVSISNPSIIEGGTARFVVSLSAASPRDVTVQYATQAGTASGARFAQSSGLLTIPAGRTSATISVPTSRDGVVGVSEQFFLKLSAAANADLASDTATATLIDGDAIPTIAASSASKREGDLGIRTIDFLVTLSSAYAGSVTVHYATADGTAIAGADFTATSGTLTFAPGITSLIVPVTVLNDITHEATETFSLVLSNPVNASIAQAIVIGTIFDNDDSPTASIAGTSAYEGALGVLTPFTFTVTLSAPSGVTGTVGYTTADGTAIAGQDYVAASGTLTFEPGVTSRTITVYVIGDDDPEFDEMFILHLSNPTHLMLAAATAAANGTMGNDDFPAISVTGGSESEGNSGTTSLPFTVTLSSAAPFPVTVTYATADGTAIAGQDYVAASGTLTFAAGEVAKTVNVVLTGDNRAEPDEAFSLNLSSPTNSTIGLGTAEGMVLDSGIVLTELSDNLSAPSGGTEAASGTNWLAAGFGTDSSGYILESVTLLLAETTTGIPEVSIHDDGGLQPGSRIGTLTAPAGYSTSIAEVAFTSTGITLSANTKYWIVLRAASGTFAWSWSQAESGGGSGTGFTNEWGDSNDSGITWITDNAYPLQMKVRAIAVS